MASNSLQAGSDKKKYPVRNRIQTDKAIASIVNWAHNDNEESELSDLTSSEEESSADEFQDDIDNADAHSDNNNSDNNNNKTNNAQPSCSTQAAPQSESDEDVHIPNKKRKKGRPSLQNQPSGSKTKSQTAADNNWKRVVGNSDTRQHEFTFEPLKEPGVYADLNDESPPLDCFFELFDETIQDKLIVYINDYAAHKLTGVFPVTRSSRFAKWYPITKYELLKFLAVVVSMGLDKRPNIEDYWSIDDTMYTPWYGEQFTRNRFEMIYSTMLHATTVEDEIEKKDKIEPFLNSLLTKFQDAFYPGQNLSIDEMVVKWKGRSKYKMYNPNKPEKYHLKTFGLCDSATGYTYSLLIYFGQDTSYAGELDKGQSEKIFHFLMQSLGTGHHIFADRYYTTHKLIEYLSSRNTFYTGTLMTNRKGFPKEMETFKKLGHKESVYYRSDEGILLCAWKDKKARKPVVAVSTFAVKSESEVVTKRGKEVTKPDMIHDYNYSMNGCDRMDQMISYYNIFNRRTVKWWKRLLMWCIEVSQINAYVLFCLTRDEGVKSVSLKKFKVDLIKGLIAEANKVIPENHVHHVPRKPNARLVRLPGPNHIVRSLPYDRNCVKCSTPAKRRRTHFNCTTCNVFLHPNGCFEDYHYDIHH